MASTISPFYRIFFTTIDPIVATTGVILPLFFPGFFLKSFAPTAVVPPRTETQASLDILAGFFAGCVLLQVFLLRARPTDLIVWRYLQANILIVDVATLGACARALSEQHRLEWTMWRWEEWANITISAAVGVIRGAFLIGIGIPRDKGSKQA